MAVDVIASKKFAVTQGSNTLNVPYDGNIDLTKPNSNVDRAVVVIHGTSRNADD